MDNLRSWKFKEKSNNFQIFYCPELLSPCTFNANAADSRLVSAGGVHTLTLRAERWLSKSSSGIVKSLFRGAKNTLPRCAGGIGLNETPAICSFSGLGLRKLTGGGTAHPNWRCRYSVNLGCGGQTATRFVGDSGSVPTSVLIEFFLHALFVHHCGYRKIPLASFPRIQVADSFGPCNNHCLNPTWTRTQPATDFSN